MRHGGSGSAAAALEIISLIDTAENESDPRSAVYVVELMF
jgi:hypothetical protein